MLKKKIFSIWLLVSFAVTTGCASGKAQMKKSKEKNISATPNRTVDNPVAFLVVTPDRGFMGNQQLRDLLNTFDENKITPFFVTDEKNQKRLRERFNQYEKEGFEKVVALPYFTNEAHPEYLKITRLIEKADTDLSIEVSKTYADSYLSELLINEKLSKIKNPGKKDLLLIGYGAQARKDQKEMSKRLNTYLDGLAQASEFRSPDALVWPESGAERLEKAARRQLHTKLDKKKNPVVVTFHLGSKFDPIRQFDSKLQGMTKGKVPTHSVPVTINKLTKIWFQNRLNRYSHRDDRDIGVVILAYGSDFLWNERMRQATKKLHDKYKIEYAFTMATRDVIDNALNRLENRGAETAVVVRVFGMASSFREKVRKLLARPLESSQKQRESVSPIATPLVTMTLGGLEDDPLFAKALLDRAEELSKNPSKETIILVAHGIGSDKRNQHWMEQLNSLKSQINKLSDDKFKAIKVGTWREDWPQKKKQSVPRIRNFVKEASKGDGRALVIPARTNGQGPGTELLKGLDYEMGTGFAPHLLFAEWVEKQIQEGIQNLR